MNVIFNIVNKIELPLYCCTILLFFLFNCSTLIGSGPDAGYLQIIFYSPYFIMYVFFFFVNKIQGTNSIIYYYCRFLCVNVL